MVRRRFGRSLAVAFIVAVSSFGLIWTSGPAQAADIGTLEKIAAVGGGVASKAGPNVIRGAVAGAAGTGTVTAVCATGVGCAALGVAAVAIIGGAVCYNVDECHDAVVPWIENQLRGGEVDDPEQGDITCAIFQPGRCDGIQYSGKIVIDPSYQPDASRVVVAVEGTTERFYVEWFGNCKNGTPFHAQAVPPADTMKWDLQPCPNQGGVATMTVRPVPGIGTQYVSGTWIYRTYRGSLVFDWGSANPSVTSANVSVVCRNPQTGATYERETITFDPTEAVRVGKCNVGDKIVGVKGSASVDGGPQLPQFEYDWTRDQAKDDRDYPLCAAAACKYSVSIDGKTCISGDPECANWTLIRRTTPDRVTCHYGPYSIDCDLVPWLERAYEDGPRTATRVNTDGDPDTADTEPKKPTIPNPTVTPSSPVIVDTIPPERPCIEGDMAKCTPRPEPPEIAEETDECWPHGWGAVNPANWVLQPMKCAIRWAVIPPPGTITGVKTAIADGWDDSTPGRWFGALPDLWDRNSDQGGSGCQGPGIPTGYLHQYTGGIPATIYPFSACEEPVSYMAQVARAGSSAAIAFFGGLRCVQQLASSLGLWIPISDAYRMQAQTDRINDRLSSL